MLAWLKARWEADVAWCRVCGAPADSDGPFCSEEHRAEYDDARQW